MEGPYKEKGLTRHELNRGEDFESVKDIPPDVGVQKNAKDDKKLKDLFKPLLMSMSIFGLYFPWWERGQRTRWSTAVRIYCCIVFLILFTTVFHYTYFNNVKVVEFGPIFALHVLSYLYLFLNIITALVMYVACYRKKGLRLIFKKWQELDKIHDHLIHTSPNLKRVIRSVVCISWLYFISSIIIFLLIQYTAETNDASLASSWVIFREACTSTGYLFHIAAWTFHIAFTSTISICLCLQFRAFANDFKDAIKTDGKFVGDFEVYRRRHQAICNLVAVVDENFSVQIGVWLCVTLTELLFEIYLSIWDDRFNSEPLPKAAMVQWMVSSLIHLCLVCFNGGMINQMAHAPLSDVYNCDLDKNAEISTKIQIFLSRLTGEKIGLSAWKMFVVDNTTILTVFGMIVTYYLVLDQFPTAASSCQVKLNTTLHE